ncbi:MAG: hypothetical protein PHS44_06605 [Candidatus Dojkabacteria bacterium]|nr:hypothetical protein [Candidatus Dojkabacteria bacterium]
MSKEKLKQIKPFLGFLIIISIIPIVGFLYSNFSLVNANNDDLYEQLEQLEKELAEIKQQKIDLDSKISAEEQLQGSLTNQIQILENSIAELKLNIKEKEIDIRKKETEIKILEEEITETRLLVEGVEKDVDELQLVANDIISTIYIDEKTNTIVDKLLTADKSEDFLSQIEYHTSLGAYDQNALSNLIAQKTLLEDEKQLLEDDKLEAEKLAEQVIKQKELLEKDKEQLASQAEQKNKMLQDSQLAAIYYGNLYASLTDEEKKMHAQLDMILQQLLNSATKPKGYVMKGQVIATEASNGCSTGSHTHYAYNLNGSWVNPCNYLKYRAGHLCSGNSSIDWPYTGTSFYITQYFHSNHEALNLVKDYGSSIVASHDGSYF